MIIHIIILLPTTTTTTTTTTKNNRGVCKDDWGPVVDVCRVVYHKGL